MHGVKVDMTICVPGKILEDVVSSSLDHHIESQGLLSHNQWGFRINYSTEGLLLYLTETWKEALDTGWKVEVLLIDFRKAFDSVNHLILQQKLKAMSVSGDFLSWFTSYFCECRQFVQLSGVKSRPRLIKYGVPQGSILGPRLFSIYANDFPEAFTDGDLFMFVNDTTIFTIVATLSNIASALTCFVALWFPSTSAKLVAVLASVYTVFSTYIIILASMSPTPPMHGKNIGSFVVIAVSIISGILISYTKLTISTIMRDRGKQALFWCGICIQTGSCIGALLMFPLVNILKLFHQ
ncbi:Solute carrier family 52, riboflavin transporter, member 3 [Stylophora pistillata]|uniref:Riboflavin transporter n=1 Tax=Stylophora pistillata TaxID=50429 RepID=A0A2B4SHQ3_STYPI|nr:Solute carrier family 52, riboflavin transporter, member 3 [Stylophora pistillata]